ncbi:MAG: IclR family transcriptional regulator [Akkermansiaceae bacterium]
MILLKGSTEGTRFLFRKTAKSASCMETKSHNIAIEESPGSVPALDRTLDILELLSDAPKGLTLSELSQRLEIPKNAVFRISQTLMARRYLTRDPETMAFRLTGQWLKLATPRLGGVSLATLARPAMTALRDVTGETTQLGVLCADEGTVIEQVEGTRSLRIVVDLGLRFPLYNNAPGKLFLAHLSDGRRNEMIADMELTPCTPRTITDKALLRKECESIVAKGFSVDHAEADEGVHCIAAPIVCEFEGVVGALWISGPAKRLPKSRFRELGEEVKDAARKVSQQIAQMG